MKRRFLATLCAAFALALVLLHGSAVAADGVLVTGAVRQPLTFDAGTLGDFAPADQVSASVTRRVDGAEHSTTVRGVRLAAVLERAALDERDRLDWRKSVVLATATDGYRAVFSWPELVNTEAGRQVLVVYERDGAPLEAREGPIALHALGDLRSGPRHVRNLVRLEVRILRD